MSVSFQLFIELVFDSSFPINDFTKTLNSRTCSDDDESLNSRSDDEDVDACTGDDKDVDSDACGAGGGDDEDSDAIYNYDFILINYKECKYHNYL